MVEINFRIITDFGKWSLMNLNELNCEGSLEGFFEIVVNNNRYGYYHNNELKSGEEGFDLINTWFENLLQSYELLCTHGYVLVSDVDSYNTWLEFKKIDNESIIISIILSEKVGKDAILTSPLNEGEVGEWNSIKVNMEEYRRELLRKAEMFIESCTRINPLFMYTRSIIKIIELIKRIKCNSN